MVSKLSKKQVLKRLDLRRRLSEDPYKTCKSLRTCLGFQGHFCSVGDQASVGRAPWEGWFRQRTGLILNLPHSVRSGRSFELAAFRASNQIHLDLLHDLNAQPHMYVYVVQEF